MERERLYQGSRSPTPTACCYDNGVHESRVAPAATVAAAGAAATAGTIAQVQ